MAAPQVLLPVDRREARSKSETRMSALRTSSGPWLLCIFNRLSPFLKINACQGRVSGI
jgi:hypothetical protein